MQLQITVKQLGKKKPLLATQSFQFAFESSQITLRDFISAWVAMAVENYNNKSVSSDELDTLKTPQEDYLVYISTTGKVGFDSIYNPNKMDVEKAKTNALQSFEDGIFAVFYGEEALDTIDHIIDLSQCQPFTFIRLTFLAGSFW